MLVWTFLRCKEYSRCSTSPRFDSVFCNNECALHHINSGVDDIYLHIARKVLNMLWSSVVYFSVWVQEIVLDSFWISIRFFYVADKNINCFLQFFSQSFVHHADNSQEKAKENIKLDKAQISRKKWTHTLDNANVALLPDLNAIIVIRNG